MSKIEIEAPDDWSLIEIEELLNQVYTARKESESGIFVYIVPATKQQQLRLFFSKE